MNARRAPISQEYAAEAMMVVCPKCRSEIDVEEEELEEGELLSCTECDGDFEVTSVEPLKLTKVSDEEEEDEEDE
jgi:alpha-aminoadipate carrier protein LysW